MVTWKNAIYECLQPIHEQYVSIPSSYVIDNHVIKGIVFSEKDYRDLTPCFTVYEHTIEYII